MSLTQGRRRMSLQSKLRVVLLLLALWDAVGLAAELTFGGPLFKISGHQISGLVGAHAGFGGANAVPMVLYLYAIVRGPLRHRGLLWLGVFEQGLAIILTLYNMALSHVDVEAIIVPLIVSVLLTVLLLANIPRQSTSS